MTIVCAKQTAYGECNPLIHEIVSRGYLPPNFCNYRQTKMATFDIESVEIKEHKRVTGFRVLEGFQSMVSISTTSNVDNTTQVFIRENSSPEALTEMVDQFMTHLEILQCKLEDDLPPEFEQAIMRLENEIEEAETVREKQQLRKYKNYIKHYSKLIVWGFNSG